MRSVAPITAKNERRIRSSSRLGDGVDRFADLGLERVRLGAVVELGIEPGAEQPNQHHRDLRVRDQRALHVSIRESDRRLAQVARDRADDRDLAPGQAGRQHEPIETVILEVRRPHVEKRLRERCPRPFQLLGRATEPEVVDPDRLRAAGGDLVRALVEHLCPHVLERRQHVRKQDAVGAQQLAAADLLSVADGPIERQKRPAGPLELGDPLDVHDRALGAPVGAVRGRERVAEAGKLLNSLLLPVRRRQRGPKIVAPGARRLGDPRLDRGDVVVLADPARTADHIVDPDQDGLRQLQAPVDLTAAERLGEDLSGELPVGGVEAVSRQAQRAGDEPVELVARDEQADPLALAETEDPDCDIEQIVGRDLDQQVTRQRLEDVDHPLRVVAVCRERRAVHHAVDLVAQQRNLARTGLVRDRRVEPDEPPLADHGAVLGEALDANVVEVCRPVDGCARVGLRQHQRMWRPRERERLGLERLRRRRRGAAQDPQPGAGDRGQLAGLAQLVLAVAEEREVVLPQPLEERLGLVELVGVDRWQLAPQLGRERGRPCPHRAPVVDRRLDLLEHQLDPGPEHRQPIGIGESPDLGMDHRLVRITLGDAARLQHLGQLAVGVADDPDHRVNDQLDPVPLPVELHRHRVDDERHVVGHDLDHRVRRVPAVALQIRVVDVDLRLARQAVLGRPPVGDDGAAQVERVAVGEILGRDPVVVLADELGVGGLRLARQARRDAGAQSIDQLQLEIAGPDGHHDSLLQIFETNLPLGRSARIDCSAKLNRSGVKRRSAIMQTWSQPPTAERPRRSSPPGG